MQGRNARIAAVGALATALAGVALAWALVSGNFDFAAFPDPPGPAVIPGARAGDSIRSGSLGGLPFATGVPAAAVRAAAGGGGPGESALAAARPARAPRAGGAARRVSRRLRGSRRRSGGGDGRGSSGRSSSTGSAPRPV